MLYGMSSLTKIVGNNAEYSFSLGLLNSNRKCRLFAIGIVDSVCFSNNISDPQSVFCKSGINITSGANKALPFIAPVSLYVFPAKNLISGRTIFLTLLSESALFTKKLSV
jgi:hypothetical protein